MRRIASPGKVALERAALPAEQHRRDRLVRIERIAIAPRRPDRPRGRQRIDAQIDRLVVEQLVDGVRQRADVRLAHHDPPAGAQRPLRLARRTGRGVRQVVEHVEQHQRAQHAVRERERVGAHLAVVPRGARDVGQLQVRDELAREPGARPELDARAQRGRRQRRGDAPVPLGVQRAQGRVRVPGPPVLLEAGDGARPLLLGERHPPYTNLIFFAATADIFSSSTPCFQRWMLVSPYVRSR